MRRIPYRFEKSEASWSAVRSQGAGGQNVNKVATAVRLVFDIRASSLPERIKQRLLALRDRRISSEGVIAIKSEVHRTQEQNLEDALERLSALVEEASLVPEPRIPTRPTKGSRVRRRRAKAARSAIKQSRRRVTDF